MDSSYKGPRLEEGDVVSLPFIRAMMDHFKDGGKLAVRRARAALPPRTSPARATAAASREPRPRARRYALAILLQVKAVLEALPTIQEVDVAAGAHLTVCGDVHGQYYDLLNVFELNGLPSPENPYLFNGDFVDRGSWSAEVVLTLFAFKVLYPGAMHLQRGNHETKAMNTVYGFDGEVRAKLNETASKLFAEVFCCLPLGAVLGGKVFVVHGGLFSRDDVTLDELKAINRFREPPDEGPFCEARRGAARARTGQQRATRAPPIRRRGTAARRCCGRTLCPAWGGARPSAAWASRLARTSPKGARALVPVSPPLARW